MINEESLIKIQELLDYDMSLSEIGDMMGMSKQRIHYYIKKGILDQCVPTTASVKKENELFEAEILIDLICEQELNISTLTEDENILLRKYFQHNKLTFVEYLKGRGWEFLLDFITKTCRICKNEKPLSLFSRLEEGVIPTVPMVVCKSCQSKIQRPNVKRYYRKNQQKLKDRTKQWQINNPERAKRNLTLGLHRRWAVQKALPAFLNDNDLNVIYNFSSKSCAVSYSSDTHIDHFIPLSWGHGGTYLGNMYLLDKKLNLSKNNHNPFKWSLDNYYKDLIDDNKWIALINWLSELNGLTPDEFRNFVYWCEDNKRMVDDVLTDPRLSIEIWRESSGLHFPIKVNKTINGALS